MIRRLSLHVPGPWPVTAPEGPIRLLAVSDERDPAFDHDVNRERLGRIDGILGCGDLEPDYLSFLADALRSPLLLVRGNHDRGAAWEAGRQEIPVPLNGRVELVAGMPTLGLSWPGPTRGRAARTELGAWSQAVSALLATARGRTQPWIVISHVPPQGHGDVAADPYHLGFAAYRWLCRRLRPALWVHGHTPVASMTDWRHRLGPTMLVNATGAVLIELVRSEDGRPADNIRA